MKNASQQQSSGKRTNQFFSLKDTVQKQEGKDKPTAGQPQDALPDQLQSSNNKSYSFSSKVEEFQKTSANAPNQDPAESQISRAANAVATRVEEVPTEQYFCLQLNDPPKKLKTKHELDEWEYFEHNQASCLMQTAIPELLLNPFRNG